MGRGHLAGHFGGAKFLRFDYQTPAKTVHSLRLPSHSHVPFLISNLSKKLLRPRDAFTPSSSAKWSRATSQRSRRCRRGARRVGG
jgi:hypothetical protein